MPTATEIERLTALLTRLVPLSAKQRGELIAADDWNTLVGALMEVGRATLGAGADGSVPLHDHPDQVTIGWLDPRLRELVTGGGLTDPALQNELARLRRDIAALSTRLDRVDEEADRSRGRLDVVLTNDAVRASAVARLDRKLLGAEDGRADVADLRATLGGLQKEVARAVHVGTLLERDGETVDVAGLVDRVAAVEDLRDRLTSPDGSLLDASALEVRLLALQGSLVSQEDLTEAIKDVRTGDATGGFDLDGILDDARAAAREAAASATATLGTDLRKELAARTSELDARVDLAVSEATSSLREDVLAAARADLDAAVSAGDAGVREELTALVKERLAAADTRMDGLRAELEDAVSSQLDGRVAQALSGALAQVEERLTEVTERVAGLDERSAGVDAALKDLSTSLAKARREDAAERAALREEMISRIATVEDRIPDRLTAGIDQARAALRADLEATVAAASRDLEVKLAAVARDAAATEVKVLATGVRSDVQALVRQELDASLTQVRADIATEVSALQPTLAGLVANEVARSTATLPQLVTAEVDALRPELTRLATTRVTGPLR